MPPWEPVDPPPEWEPVGDVKGPKGDKGDKGDEGDPGPAGDASTSGRDFAGWYNAAKQ